MQEASKYVYDLLAFDQEWKNDILNLKSEIVLILGRNKKSLKLLPEFKASDIYLTMSSKELEAAVH